MKEFKLCCLTMACLSTLTDIAYAEKNAKGAAKQSTWDYIKEQVSTTWASDQYELYVPLHTWHNRLLYDRKKTKKYNENPWGAGFGNYRYDDEGNWHALYAMAFKDSHNEWEPIAGYGYQWMWVPDDLDGWRMGAGFTAAVTARDDYSYVPIPIILPIASIEYNRLSIQTTYIPGTYNNGNVLFTWMRWQF